jgi:hypothetical protein
MSFLDDEKVLLTRLVTQLAAAQPTIKVKLPNDVKTITDDLWVDAVVTPGDTRTVSSGNETGQKRVRTVGVVQISVMAKPDGGSGPAMSLADVIVPIMQLWKNGNIKTRAASIQRLGLSGGWYQVNVIVPYQSDRFS